MGSISELTQEAVRLVLAVRRTDAWLDGIPGLKGPSLDVASVLAAIREARDGWCRTPDASLASKCGRTHAGHPSATCL